MGSGQEWWANKEREMQAELTRQEERWQQFRTDHPEADPDVLRAEFNRAEAVRFTLEKTSDPFRDIWRKK